MRALLLTLSFFCFTFIFCSKSNAAHVSGTEISYKCTNIPGTIEVTLILYNRCTGSGTPVCPSPCGSNCLSVVMLAGADSGYNNTTFGSITMQLQNVRDVDKKTTCPAVKNVCTNSGCVTAGTFSPGFERYEFKGLVNIGPTSGIPAGCCNVKLSYSMCCRSGYINTGSAAINYYNEAIVNRCLTISPCNSSPVFKNDPQVAIIGGQPYIGNWGATDPEHDSLSYSFAPSLYDQLIPTGLYTPPFAYDRPMPWTGNATGVFPQGIHCDPLTGDIMFTPPNSGGSFTGIVCIAVKQWKKINGVPKLISTTIRDVEMIVEGSAYPNNPPRLTTSPPENSNPNDPKTKWTICAGEPFCFTITAKDTDFNLPFVSDTTYIRWDSALANRGATFVPDYDISKRQLHDSLGGGPREDRYKFCWTPADSLVSSNPYYFTVSAADKRCPTPGELTRAFSILVQPKISAQIIQTTGSCQKTFLSYTNLLPSVNIAGAFWRIAKAPNDSTFANGFNTYFASTTPTPFLFKNAGRFYIQLEVIGEGPIGTQGCSKTYSRYVDATGISLQDSIQTTNLTCALIPSGKIVLKGYNGTAPYQYKLNNGIYTHNDTFTNLMAGKYTTWVKDSNGCETQDTVVLSQPTPISTIIKKVSPLCFNDNNGSISIQTTGGIPPYTYQLNQAGFQSDSAFSNLASGQYRIMVKDVNACIKMDSVTILNPPQVSAHYTVIPTSCFNGTDGKIAISQQVGKAPFRYRLNQQPAQTIPLFENLQAATYLVTLTDSALCQRTDSVTVTQPAMLSYVKNKTEISCYNANDASISIIPGGGTAPYQLLFDSVLYPIPSTVQSIKPGNYRYHIIDSKNCKLELMDSFENPPQIIVGSISGDSNVMVNTTHTYTVPFQPNLSFAWTVTGGTLLSSSMNPPSATVRWDSLGSGMIGVVVYNSLSCGDTSILNVNIGSVGLTELTKTWGLNVYPNPAKNILNISLQKLPEATQIELYDIQGKLVLQQELKLTQQLDIEKLTAGVYILKIGAWSGQVVKE